MRLLLIAALAAASFSLRADEGAPVGPPVRISRAAGPITIDGDLSDEGWKGAARVDVWYETNPGDNLDPKVKNVAYLTYDDKFFYAGFEFSDPQPERIRAPLGDRDNVPSSTDYGGVIVDTRNDGRTGFMFLANPRGIQYDAISDDAGGGEDSSPDFYWDSAGKIGKTGWTLEIRIPFASLRYENPNPEAWRILLYRNYPREYRYQFFTSTLPRGGQCFVCRGFPLTGLEKLPSGGKIVAAPYVSLSRESVAEGGAGSPLENRSVKATGGLDLKWMPRAGTSLDATVNPDFSQVESDVAQISANERFALFYPEKRPFFLEGIELFSTPIRAVYTRTITAPRWGLRATGKLDKTAYTILLAEDKGGGSVILPGPEGSNFADQDFKSRVGILRARYDLGRSFVSVLATDREVTGGGSNRVFGPDFQLRLGSSDTVTGQFLYSFTKTPNRPDLAEEWDGRSLDGHAAQVWWSHSTNTFDAYAQVEDVGRGFRADDGFVPQTGYRREYGEAGYTFRPTGLVTRVRLYLFGEHQAEPNGRFLFRLASPGFGLDAKWNTFVRLRYETDAVRTGDSVFHQDRFVWVFQTNPGRVLQSVYVDGFVGGDIDFANVRRAHGGRVSASAYARATDHLEFQLIGDRRWVDVSRADGAPRERLFTATVARVRATYNLNARSFFRAIAQWVETKRDPSLYASTVAAREGTFSASALFAYKLNWQTVLFLGYGDERERAADERFAPVGRQLFLKVSYAFQR